MQQAAAMDDRLELEIPPSMGEDSEPMVVLKEIDRPRVYGRDSQVARPHRAATGHSQDPRTHFHFRERSSR